MSWHKRIVKIRAVLIMALLLSVCAGILVSAQAAEVKKLKMNYTSLSLKEGDRYTVKVQGYSGKKKVNPALDWSSSNSRVATVELVSRNKIIVQAHQAGSAVIRATAGNGVKASCKIKVSAKPLRLAMADTGWNANAASLAGCFTGRGISVTLIRNANDAHPEWYDGLLIPGGEDVNPGRYGEGYNGAMRGNDAKDALQISVIRQFAKARKPMLGVCRGQQIINVAFGGSLHQHIPGHAGAVRRILNEKGTYVRSLLGAESVLTHFHHEAVKKVAKDFIVTQRDSADGTIEGIYNPTRHIYCYQWHPELSGSAGALMFDVFLEACRKVR